AVAGQSLEEAAAALWGAVAEGHLVAVDDSFRFTHDRVQQAAYGQVPEDECRAIHLQVGRYLLAQSGPAALDERLFEVVDQLGLGAALITDGAERLRVAELGLRAARRARASSAWGPALGYLEQALTLLPEDVWQSHHELAFALHRDATEVGFLAGQ